MAYPRRPAPALSPRFVGRPRIARDATADQARAACAACPFQAVTAEPRGLRLDTGRCLFCRECESASGGAIRFTTDHRLAARQRSELIAAPGQDAAPALKADTIRRLFGRSLKLREVSAGGCNACEADVNVLNTLAWDLGRFGIQFVASPRHADGLLITGPVSGNMRLALEKTYAATPTPRIVIAVGACAIAGGPYAGHPETCSGADSVVPVDLYVPGCPPHPLTILEGLLGLLGKVDRL